MNRLYYFSGTGNTLYLAQRLADEIGNCELVSIASALKEERIEESAERVGVLFPAYCFGYPLIIGEFLKKLRVSPDTYLFGCCSFGGLLGGTMELFRKAAETEGLTVQAGFAVQMPGNAIFVYDRLADTKIEKMNSKLEQRLPTIANVIVKKQAKKMEQFPFPLNKIMSHLYTKMIPDMHKGAAQFRTTESCGSCGSCADICPKGNITVADGAVTWGTDCEMCMACIQWCPNGAIEFGEKTVGRTRYNHSCISAKDIAVQGK